MARRESRSKMDPRTKRAEVDAEICNQCGRSVAWGNGWFVNRVPDLDTLEDREAMGRPYPEGDWICADCDSWCPDCGDLAVEQE